jgi:hypothetical protein
MNNKFLYAGKCFVCLLVHSLLWGCTSLNDAPAESDNAETIITFTMEVGGNVSGTATRANDTWNDSYNEESSTYDSSIDPEVDERAVEYIKNLRWLPNGKRRTGSMTVEWKEGQS